MNSITGPLVARRSQVAQGTFCGSHVEDHRVRVTWRCIVRRVPAPDNADVC